MMRPLTLWLLGSAACFVLLIARVARASVRELRATDRAVGTHTPVLRVTVEAIRDFDADDWAFLAYVTGALILLSILWPITVPALANARRPS